MASNMDRTNRSHQDADCPISSIPQPQANTTEFVDITQGHQYAPGLSQTPLAASNQAVNSVDNRTQLPPTSTAQATILPTNDQHTSSRATHPALSSHMANWAGVASIGSLPADNDGTEREKSPPGAVVLDDSATLSKPPRPSKHGTALTTRKTLSKKRGGRGGASKTPQNGRRGTGFSKGETESLLELSTEHLPLGKEEWEKVARLHELRYPQQHRNADSLRRKFAALCRTVPPTGDPSIPSEVMEAKEIRKAMTERADMGEGDESDDAYTEELEGDSVSPRSGTPAANSTVASLVPDNTDPVQDSTASAQPGPPLSRSTTPTPRPLVRKRVSKPVDEDESILTALKANMLQEQMRREDEYRKRMLDREEEKERRAEERLERQQERQEERERRAEERKRSDQMTQMMMIALLGPRAREMFNDNGSKDTC